MAKEVYTEIDGQRVKLTNLDKTLFPEQGIVKAEYIQYVITLSDYLLEHLEYRPLTIIRFPDGIEKKGFYAKDKPKWTPDWISSYHVKHDKNEVDYLVVEKKATLVWLANLAAIEIHRTQYKTINQGRPDHIVFDLDPDPDMPFDALKETAILLKEFLSSRGYTSFVKTSGGKGLHVIVPIDPQYDYPLVTEHCKTLAKAFIKKHPKNHTLHLNKAKRNGKVLIDIFRNHPNNTTCAAFSLRSKPGAPVSMPLTWEELEKVTSSQQYKLREVVANPPAAHPWGDWMELKQRIGNAEVQLTEKQSIALEDYNKKRNFEKTNEPEASDQPNRTNAYVIQLHDASNLHYDLRLEHEGTLLSWAIPKGLPFESSAKRLAIQTENHPLEYLDFEGFIPKGEYGGGEMRIIEKGSIKWHKKSERKYEFELSSRKGTYKLFHTKEKQWITTVDKTEDYAIKYEHMLASMGSATVKNDKNTAYEVKWDGIRVMFYVMDGSVKIISRNGNELTEKFPELHSAESFEIEQGVYDGEIVVLDDKGRAVFADVISRMHSKGEKAIERLIKSKTATLYLFDVLQLDGKEVTGLTLRDRYRLLHMTINTGERIRISEYIQDGNALFEAVKIQGIEGIMAKDLNAQYTPGKRTQAWIKYKVRDDMICDIIGYTEGKGDRAGLFGSMHLASQNEDGTFLYRGRVGTGFSMSRLKELFAILEKIPHSDKLIEDTVDEEQKTTWIEPKLQCHVQYASLTPNKTLREPVFLGLIEQEIAE